MRTKWWVVGVAAATLISAGRSWAVGPANEPKYSNVKNAEYVEDQKEAANELKSLQTIVKTYENKYGFAIFYPEDGLTCASNVCVSAKNIIRDKLKEIGKEIDAAHDLDASRARGQKFPTPDELRILRAKKLIYVTFNDAAGVLTPTRAIHFDGDGTIENPGREITIDLRRWEENKPFSGTEGSVSEAFRHEKRTAAQYSAGMIGE